MMEGPGFDTDGVQAVKVSLSQGIVGVRVTLDQKFSGEEIEIALNAKAKSLIKRVSFSGVILDDYAKWHWEFSGRSVLWDVQATLDEFAHYARAYIYNKRLEG